MSGPDRIDCQHSYQNADLRLAGSGLVQTCLDIEIGTGHYKADLQELDSWMGDHQVEECFVIGITAKLANVLKNIFEGAHYNSCRTYLAMQLREVTC